MNFILQNPGLIGFVPLITIPVLVHFFVQARPPEYLFSATAFIKKVILQTIRIKRPKDRLLLLCRTLLFVVLMLIFLRPKLFLKDWFVDQNLPRRLVVLIDRSASMAWSEGGRSRFSSACDEADALLEGLSSQDVANIIWIDGEPDAVFPEAGSNTEYLREKIRSATCSNEAGQPENAIQLALSQLNTGPGIRELCIISDFQLSQWKNIPLSIPENIVVSTLCPVRDMAVNGAVQSLTTEPLAPLAGETTRIIVTVSNFSGTPRSRTVTLKIDEHIVTKQVQLPSWGSGAVSLEYIFPRKGTITASARLDEDSFGVDDWRAVNIPVRQALAVAICGDDTLLAPVFRRALRALPWVETIEIPNLDFENAKNLDLVILTSWTGEYPEMLTRLREEGLPFIISPAPGLPFETLARRLDLNPSSRTGSCIAETLDKALGMTLINKNHKSVSLFMNGEYGDPFQAAFTRRLVFQDLDVGGKPLAAFTDGKPALIEFDGPSSVVLWLAPLSPECSNWASQSPFLPFFGELLASLRNFDHVILPEAALTGESLTFKASSLFDDSLLYDESGSTFPVKRLDTVDSGSRFVSGPINEPGIYRLCTKTDCSSPQIINFPAIESDLRTGQPPMITKAPVRTVRNVAELNKSREGTDLWKILVWTALLLIVFECLLVLMLDNEEAKIARGKL